MRQDQRLDEAKSAFEQAASVFDQVDDHESAVGVREMLLLLRREMDVRI